MLRDLKLSDYAEKLSIFSQALNRKFNTQVFSVSDLIKLADLTSTTLSFVDSGGKVVMAFDNDDLTEKKEG